MTTLYIHTDESIFPDPWTFDPERWLEDSGKEIWKY
jgi:cytochrome P450